MVRRGQTNTDLGTRNAGGREQRVPREGAWLLGRRSWSLGKSLDLAWGCWPEGEVPPVAPVVTELEMLQKKNEYLLFWRREEGAAEMAQESLLNKQGAVHSCTFILIFSLF